jgi:hypothetical protein
MDICVRMESQTIADTWQQGQKKFHQGEDPIINNVRKFQSSNEDFRTRIDPNGQHWIYDKQTVY